MSALSRTDLAERVLETLRQSRQEMMVTQTRETAVGLMRRGHVLDETDGRDDSICYGL